MNLFRPFRTRSASRDEETDRQRLERLSLAVASVREEVEREQAGLRRRYDESQRDAGFAAAALDEKPSNAKLAGSVDQHSQTILNCEKRLHALEAQKRHLAKLDELLAELPDARPS